MVTQILVNIGSGNGLLPDASKLLPDPMLTNHQEIHQPSITKISLKIIDLKSSSNLKGANELNIQDTLVTVVLKKGLP